MERVSIQRVDKDDLRDAVRQAIAEERAAEQAAAPSADEDDVPEEGDEVAAPEVEARIQAGQEYIAEAVEAGYWGPEQVAYVSELGATLSGEQMLRLVRPLNVAINAGRVMVDVDGPPF